MAEIDFMTNRELSDVSMVVTTMVKPDGDKGGGKDPYWENAATALLNGVILHLLYSHHKENKPLPSPGSIMSFLSQGNMKAVFEKMQYYPHISPEEFYEEETKRNVYDENGERVKDENGKFLEIKEKKINILKKLYGDYIQDYTAINNELHRLGYDPAKKITNIEQAQKAIKSLVENPKIDKNGNQLLVTWESIDEKTPSPLAILLTHPKVYECASNNLNNAEATRASIMSTAQTALAIYQDPVVQYNTSVCDFCIRDMLDPRQAVSLYLVMQVKDIATVKPIARLFINTIINKLVKDMKFDTDPDAKPLPKQRLLLMLDEFPQLGNLPAVEKALAICAGYGIKMCIVAQDMNQLNKEYTKENSVGSNCHVQIYFTPNLDGGASTAESLSKMLGKKTIKTVSHSDGGGLGKGSNSESFTGRELMTASEVSQMPKTKELVLVAGHKPILGDKLFYFKHKYFMSKIKNAPLVADTATKILSYDDLFRVNEAEAKEFNEKVEKIAEYRAKMETAATGQNDEKAVEKDKVSLKKKGTTQNGTTKNVRPADDKRKEKILADQKDGTPENAAPKDARDKKTESLSQAEMLKNKKKAAKEKLKDLSNKRENDKKKREWNKRNGIPKDYFDHLDDNAKEKLETDKKEFEKNCRRLI